MHSHRRAASGGCSREGKEGVGQFQLHTSNDLASPPLPHLLIRSMHCTNITYESSRQLLPQARGMPTARGAFHLRIEFAASKQGRWN